MTSSRGSFQDPERAREAGRKGGQAKARARLTLSRVEAELPPLTDLDSAMKRLDRIGTWALAGLLQGAVAGAAARSCEIWVRAHESKLTAEVVQQLRARLEALEGQIKSQRAGGAP